MNEYDLGLGYLTSMGILPADVALDPNDPFNIGFSSDVLSAGVNNPAVPGGSFFSSIGDFLSGGGGQALGAGAGALLAKQAYDRLGSVGERARREAGLIGQTGLEQTEFKPFTVTTATDGMFTVDDKGGATMTLSPEEEALQTKLLSGASQFFGNAQTPTADRETAVYERMRAAMSPEEERQRLAQEQRLAAQGRLGVRTSQFGGTSEQLALAKAQEEARNNAMLAAMQQAQAEQAQQASLGQQFLGASYIPQAQLIGAVQPSLTTSQLAQRGQFEGANLFGEAQMSGLEALLASGTAQGNILGQLGTGLLSQSLQPTFVGGGTDGSGGANSGGLFGSISDLLGITDTNDDGTWWSRLFGG